MNTQFILLFFIFVAVAAFIAKHLMSRRDERPGIEEIVSEIIPILNDPAALHRKVVRDLRGMRMQASGEIVDIVSDRKGEIIRIRDRVAADEGGMGSERDVVYELLFMFPDTLDDAGPGLYVEFTGLLIDITAGTGMPVITVDPGEILYIGDGPPDGVTPEEPPGI